MNNNNMMVNKNKVIIGIIIVLVIILFVNVKEKREKAAGESGYSVVYLTTGDVYIGKLSTFPRLELTDGYIFQVIKDPTDPSKTSFQLNPLKDSLWAPSELVLSEKNVVFYGPLLSSSKIAQTIAGTK